MYRIQIRQSKIDRRYCKTKEFDMTPVNEVPVGKFCRFVDCVVYLYKNNFKNSYGLLPIAGTIPTNKAFEYKVYIYKRVKKDWVRVAKKWLNNLYETQAGQTLLNGHVVKEDDKRLDNLTYIENLNILKNYDKSDIVSED
jgi:hypothetical protein